MAPSPEIPVLTIDALQAQDDQEHKELSPEKKTLNQSRVINFLHRNGFTSGTVEKNFNLESAIRLTSEGQSKTEKSMNSQFTEAANITRKYNIEDVFSESTEPVVSTKLDNYKTPPKNLPPSEAAKVMQAWRYFNLVRENARKLLEAEESVKATLTQEKGVGQSIEDGVKEKLGDARQNWDKLSTGQKVAMAAIALVGGVMFFKSENGVIKGIRETLMTGAKVAGAAWLFNKVWYLFTGESMLDSVTGTAKGSGKHSEFLKKSFNTNDAGAEALSRAMVQIGELRFVDLIEKYEKAGGKNTIEVPGMPGDQAYMAIDLFVKKYGLVRLKSEYGKYDPPIAFSQVITIEMSKDPSIKMDKALTNRVGEGISDGFKIGYNYLASTGAAVWLVEKYRQWFGKAATPDQLKDFAKKFGEMVQDENELNQAITERLVKDKNISKNFVDTNLTGISQPKYNLRYRKAPDGYVYMIVDKPMGNVQGDEKALNNAVQDAVKSAEEFLVDQYGGKKDEATGKMEPYGSVFIAKSGTLKYLVRYKVR